MSISATALSAVSLTTLSESIIFHHSNGSRFHHPDGSIANIKFSFMPNDLSEDTDAGLIKSAKFLFA